MNPRKITVIGAGSWGTALAVALCQSNEQVLLLGRDENIVNSIQEQKVNYKYLPNINLPKNLLATTDINLIEDSEYIVLAIPSSSFETILSSIKDISDKIKKFIIATKGISQNGKWLQEVVKDVFPEAQTATLVGPSFAKEVATLQATAMASASQNESYGKEIAELFSHNTLKVYYQNDVVGAQLGGIIKNILAVAVGVAEGAGLGSNSKAALITRGFNEMSKLALKLGAKEKTLFGLTGLGDTVLTCSDNQSRNKRFGVFIGQNLSYEEAVSKVGQTIEANNNLNTTLKLAKKHNIELPITESLFEILAGNLTPLQAMQKLMSRPIVNE